MNRRWLFTVFDDVTMFWVLLLNSVSRTDCGVAVGNCCRCRAAAPAVCGAAIDVPLLTAVAVSLLMAADVMLAPGENQSTQEP